MRRIPGKNGEVTPRKSGLFSIKPLNIKVFAGEQKATKVSLPRFPGLTWATRAACTRRSATTPRRMDRWARARGLDPQAVGFPLIVEKAGDGEMGVLGCVFIS